MLPTYCNYIHPCKAVYLFSLNQPFQGSSIFPFSSCFCFYEGNNTPFTDQSWGRRISKLFWLNTILTSPCLLTLMNFQSRDWNVRFRHTRWRSIISKCSPSGQHWDFSPETPESTSSAKYIFSPTTKVDESGKSTSLIVWNDLWVPECTFRILRISRASLSNGIFFNHDVFLYVTLKIRKTIIWPVENGTNWTKGQAGYASLLVLLPTKSSFFALLVS